MMEGFPESIRHTQMAAACAALGLPAKVISHFSADVHEGLMVEAYITDAGGERIHHAGDFVTTVLRIPINNSPAAT